jgi:hypothetical protein
VEFVKKLTALVDHCGQSDFRTPIAVRRRRRLFRFIPYSGFDCKLSFGERGDCWGVMLNPHEDPHRKPNQRRPYLGADFRKIDGARDTAWKMVAKTWLPVLVDDETAPIFERIEDAVHRAYESLESATAAPHARKSKEPCSPLGAEIRRRARRGAVIVGASVFTAMLLIALILRVNQFRMFRWQAIGLLLRFDLLIVLCASIAGALVGAATGALLALLSRLPNERREPEKHPLD